MRFREILEDITPQEAGSFVNFAKNAFGSKKIEIRVTGHFLEGFNNPRNEPPISYAEIVSVIKKLLKQHGESIKKIPAGKDATIVDQQTSINIPVVFEDPRKEEFDARIVLKTVQRKNEYLHYDLPIILEAVGRITKQNQTQDVGPQEVKKQAAKFGNTVDRDGRPPTLSKKTKGSKTNVLFNLGLAESVLDELNIPRNQMPQISMKDLKGRYDLESDSVDPSTLETSQDQRIPGMVDKTVKSIKNGFDKPLVIDKNGFIVNGHHRYDAYLELGVSQVPVIRVKDASIEELIQDFSHTAKDTYAEDSVLEKWSKKYKDSIDCSNPKGFSQKAHCAGKKKNENREIGIHRSSEDFAVIDLSKSADGTFWLNGVDNTDWDSTVTTGKGVDMAFEISPQAELASYDDIDKYSTGELENMGYDGVRMVDGDNVTYQIWNTDILKRTQLGENFADGKKKGKSRPGRAKTAGVDCSKSVTALRKQAKNSSGEKQKMAHWCANMKAGRKKS